MNTALVAPSWEYPGRFFYVAAEKTAIVYWLTVQFVL